MDLNDNQNYSVDNTNEKSTEKRMYIYSGHKRYDQQKNKKRHRAKHYRYLTDKGSSSKFLNRSVNTSVVYKTKSFDHINTRRHHTNNSRSKKMKAYELHINKNSSSGMLNNNEKRNGVFDSMKNKLNRNSHTGGHHNISKKLPVLASIELVKDQQVTASANRNFLDSKKSINEKVLFKDYVLIPAGTPFKHLVYTVLDHVNFPNKNEYTFINGYLKVENWMPISLESISTIVQCPLSEFSSSSSHGFLSPSTSVSKNTKQSLESVEKTSKNETSNEPDNKSQIGSVNNETKYTNYHNFDKEAKTVTDNINNNSDHVNNKNSINSSSSINVLSIQSNTENQRRTSRSTSIVSSNTSEESSSRYSSSSRSHDRHQRRFSSSSNNKHSEYDDSDYENDYDSDSNLQDNTSTKTSESMTVNDILSHVISFAELNIKLTLKNRGSETQLQKHNVSQNQFCSSSMKYEDVEKRNQEPEVNNSQSFNLIQQHLQHKQQKFQQTNATQHNLMQNFMMSFHKQSIDLNQQQQMQQNPSTNGPLASLIQNASMMTQQSQNPKQSSENEIQKKFNELLLPMLMMANSSNPPNSTQPSSQNPSPSFSSTPNPASTSHLTNSQLASLLPILNLPIFSQLLNNLKSNEQNQNAGQQQQLNVANSLTRLIKSSEAAGASLSLIDSATNSLNQPLNLSKELSQIGAKSSGQGFQSPSGNNGKKQYSYSIPTSKSPSPPLSMHNNIKSESNRNLLSVNVNGPGSTVNTNANSASVFNNSPSPSVSSSSSSSDLSSEKPHMQQKKFQTLNQQQSSAHQSNHLKQNTSCSSSSTPVQSRPSYLINNRRQRERTTFDPQEEITRLMTIFERTHHPTRYQIASICDSLNSLSCRRDKKPLEPYNIQYWFKNARAALRRKVKVENNSDGNDRRGGSNAISSNNTTNSTIGSGISGKLQSNSELDMIFNNSIGENLQANPDYLNSKYSNYDEEENDLDEEEYDEDFDHENGNLSIDESNKLSGNVDMNNNHMHNEDMRTFVNEDLMNSHGDDKNNEMKNNENPGNHHLDHMSNHSETYENYDEANYTIDDDEAHGQYISSNYANIENSNENEDCNESYDDDHYKNNHSNINSPGMINIKSEIHQKNMNKSMINGGSGSMNHSSSSMCNNRRNRVFIDPISEVPILEHYFSLETYPDHYLIEKICENLNKGEYRFKFPKLESRNIQLWFKNHRAKLKRLKSTPNSGGCTQNVSAGNSGNNAASDIHHQQKQLQSILDGDGEMRTGNFNVPGKINI